MDQDDENPEQSTRDRRVQARDADHTHGVFGDLARVLAPEAIAKVAKDALPSLVLSLAAAQAAVAARITEDATRPRDESYATVEEVAAQLKVDVAWVYRHAARWPFAVKLSGKVVRVERAGLKRWLAQHRRR